MALMDIAAVCYSGMAYSGYSGHSEDLIKTAFQIDIHEIVGGNKNTGLYQLQHTERREILPGCSRVPWRMPRQRPFFFLYPTISSRLFRIFHYYGGMVFSGLERKSAIQFNRIA